jgi:UDP-galactopyranose mutase
VFENVDLLVCGAGPVGSLLAERAASQLGWRVLVLDRRAHVAGNCHDGPAKNGVLVHSYGPHYFRTNDDALLKYLSRFSDFVPANYEVRSQVRGELLPFPINLDTLERFFGTKLDAESAEALLASKRVPIARPANSEEFVLSRVGRELYEAFYLNYTLKQWGVHPRDLDASVCGRVPVRLCRDSRYVNHTHQVMPRRGFTSLFASMLKHPRIRVELNCDFGEVRDLVRPRVATVYTGPVDEYFGHRFGRLPYRSLKFEFETRREAFAQPCVQINYPNEREYTRSVEIKHVTGQRHPETAVCYETPTNTGEPFYPVPRRESAALYARYKELADAETARRAVYFCGRLAQYRYFNTDEVLLEALACFETIRRRFAGARASSPQVSAA